MHKYSKGITFAIITATLSGVSVFINGFASQTFSDPFIFTTLKNIIVALLLSSIVIGLFSFGQIKKLKVRDWLVLIVIGLIGGSIPFLLFFKGLSLTDSSIAAFSHKTLFIWATIFALIWLKEKISFYHLIGFVALLIGIGLMSPWKNLGFGAGELLALIATLSWAAEAVLIRKISNLEIGNWKLEIPTLTWGRMFFGAMFMLAYIGLIGRIGDIGRISTENTWWLMLTSVFLVGYVTLWYSSLKHAPIVVATSILAIGFPITVLLKSIFVTGEVSGSLVLGLIIVISATMFLLRPIRTIGRI